MKIMMWLLLFLSTSAHAAEISVRTDRNPVNIDESFQIIFEAKGSVDDDPDFSAIVALVDVISQSQSSSISIINGSMSRSKIWTINAIANRAGTIQIPSIAFGKDRSTPYTIQIKQGGSKSVSTQDSFFINVEVDQQEVVQNQQIILTIRVFSDRNLSQLNLSDLEFNHDNVMIEVLGEETQYQTRIGQKAYLVVEKKLALFAQTPGKLTIQPVLAEAGIGGSSRSIFDSFSRSKIVRARSEPKTINISPKSTNFPNWLPAKNVRLSQKWSDDIEQLTVGEPVTRTISIQVNGLSASQIPEMPALNLHQFKQYPDQPELDNRKNANGIIGVRTEKIAYIPSNEGEHTLPAIKIPWWNTQTRQWQTATLPSQRLQVKPTPSVQSNIGQAPVAAPVLPSSMAENPAVPASQSIVAAQSESPAIWQLISLILLIGWGLSTFYLLKNKKNQKPHQEKTQETLDFKMAALKKACHTGDLQTAKNELIKWAQATYQDRKITSLGHIKRYADAALQSEIAGMESSLYQRKKANWNGKQLYQLVKAIKQDTSADAASTALQPLFKIQ